jgi:hypothetical protein
MLAGLNALGRYRHSWPMRLSCKDLGASLDHVGTPLRQTFTHEVQETCHKQLFEVSLPSLNCIRLCVKARDEDKVHHALSFIHVKEMKAGASSLV